MTVVGEADRSAVGALEGNRFDRASLAVGGRADHEVRSRPLQGHRVGNELRHVRPAQMVLERDVVQPVGRQLRNGRHQRVAGAQSHVECALDIRGQGVGIKRQAVG